MSRWSFAVLALAVVGAPLLFSARSPAADDPATRPALAAAVDQLRHARGRWSTLTEFLAPDGSIARSAEGAYEFSWVVPDRVLSGRSEIPELEIASGILFYVNESKSLIEMASVGRDGHLWVMNGPADSETRTTPQTAMSDGSTMQLRFTRYNVMPRSFESRMDISTDGGKTWRPGNHQVFTRVP
jgi:hypothetical protein